MYVYTWFNTYIVALYALFSHLILIRVSYLLYSRRSGHSCFYLDTYMIKTMCGDSKLLILWRNNFSFWPAKSWICRSLHFCKKYSFLSKTSILIDIVDLVTDYLTAMWDSLFTSFSSPHSPHHSLLTTVSSPQSPHHSLFTSLFSPHFGGFNN